MGVGRRDADASSLEKFNRGYGDVCKLCLYFVCCVLACVRYGDVVNYDWDDLCSALRLCGVVCCGCRWCWLCVCLHGMVSVAR